MRAGLENVVVSRTDADHVRPENIVWTQTYSLGVKEHRR